MKQKIIPVAVVILLLILIIGGVFAAKYIERYIPTKEMADMEELLGVSGEDTAVYYNDERLTGFRAITRDNQTYLPIEWVKEYLNERFYWDDVEKLLVYTLPESIVYADKRTIGNSGKPLLLEEDDHIYLSASLVASYTDIRMELYTEPVNRIYIWDEWEPRTAGIMAKTAAVRVRGGIKSPILTTIAQGAEFVLLEEGENWSRIFTDDGYVGWVMNRQIEGIYSQEQTSTFKEPEYTSISLGEKVCMVWHQVLREEDNGDMERLIARTQGVNVIAPTWLMLVDNDGNYESYASREYVDKAHALGLSVWAVLDNFNKGENVNSAILFAKTSARKALIEHLMDDVLKYQLDGIDLDIESISQEAMPHYVQFIRELSVACRQNKVILSVVNHVPSEYTQAYNRKEQGIVADYVVIMGYDEHYSGSEPGSVASLPFVRKGIEDTLKEVPKEKVINGVPFYTRRWNVGLGQTTSTALGLEAAAKWVEENHVNLYWQEELGQYYGELNLEDSTQLIWLEDERSLELKLGLIDEYDLAGVAFWKLGLDTEDIWNIIKVNE